MPEPRAVRSMFARIAGRYDFLNRTLSGGMDQRWRRRVARRLAPVEGRVMVDVACGTGDLALELARGRARVIGVDFTAEMLARAPAKAHKVALELAQFAAASAARRHASTTQEHASGTRGQASTALGCALDVTWLQGDAMHLPLRDASVDAVTIAFGLRNVIDRSACLIELARVLRPGGRLVVLECGLPRNRVLGALFRGYFTKVLPRLGGWISGDRAAYEYLPATVLAWPGPVELATEIGSAGFTDARFESLSGGVAYLHIAARR